MVSKTSLIAYHFREEYSLADRTREMSFDIQPDQKPFIQFADSTLYLDELQGMDMHGHSNEAADQEISPIAVVAAIVFVFLLMLAARVKKWKP